jgi:hypothetical protein
MLAQILLASIVVLSNFEGGSVGKVERVSPVHLRCAVEGQSDQDHRNRQASWYFFELKNLPKQPVTIELVEIAGEYNYQAPAYAVNKNTRPVYSYDGVNWRHFRDDQVSWDEAAPRLILRFTPEDARLWIAHVQPYTNKNLASLLDSFRLSPYLEQKSVGPTVEGREMPLLTITNPRTPEAGKKVIWLKAQSDTSFPTIRGRRRFATGPSSRSSPWPTLMASLTEACGLTRTATI